MGILRMKGKTIAILVAVILLIGTIFTVQFTGGFKGINNSNPLKNTNGDLSRLYKDANFDFMLPNIVTDGTFGSLISAETVAESLVQIEMEKATFWAAPFISYDADPSGDYNKYEIDNQYITSDKSFYIRYRTNTLDKTLLMIKWDSVVYSISMNYYVSQEDILPKFGIDISNFVEYTPDMVDNQQTDNTDTNSNDIENKDIMYTTYKNSELNVQFMLPVINGKLETVVSRENSTISIMVNSKLMVMLQYKDNIYNIDTELETKLLGNWVMVVLPDMDGEELDEDQIILKNSIETIASTFKETNS